MHGWPSDSLTQRYYWCVGEESRRPRKRAKGRCGCRWRRRPEWRGEAGALGWLTCRALCPQSPHPSVSEWVISRSRCRRRWPLRNCIILVVYRYPGIALGSTVWQMSWKDIIEETAYSPHSGSTSRKCLCCKKKKKIHPKVPLLCRIHLTNVFY